MSAETVQEIAPAGRVIPEWTVADRLRKVRRMAKMTQAEFADAMRVGKAQLQGWESEHSRPSYQHMMVIAMQCEHLLGVPVEWMLEGDERATADSLEFAKRAGAAVRHYAVTGEELFSENDNGRVLDEEAADEVRHVGLEPTTRWLTVVASIAAPNEPAPAPETQSVPCLRLVVGEGPDVPRTPTVRGAAGRHLQLVAS